MYQFELSITMANWLTQPELRWNAGLENAGLQFRQRLQRENYPPQPPLSTYVRTGTLANKAGFNIIDLGKVAEVGSTFYLPYLIALSGGPENWSGKRDELYQYIQAGFKEGVKNYTE